LPDPTDLPLSALEAWFAREGIELAPPLRAELIAGGRSNLTYLVTDAAGSRVVLRRPPLAGVVASAHDVVREHRIMAALADTGVPVPQMLARCTDDSVLGAPFIVMAHVDGVVLRDRDGAEAALPETARVEVGPGLVDALVALHAVRPEQVGLADLGRGVSYVQRQLTRWAGQLDRLGVGESAEMRALLPRLNSAVPEQRECTIVHGDFRPGNAIVDATGQVRAILDWELATLGEPMADLGWFIAYWGDADRPPLPVSVPTRAAGFADAATLVDQYAAKSGRDVTQLDFYVAFALWRLAAILAGVNARARRGAYGAAGEAIADAGADERVAQLVTAAADAATRAGA
jgi:aminoglycoside phosphotransferase (APT) family kinase protein